MREKKWTPGPWSWWSKCCNYKGGAITSDEHASHIVLPILYESYPEITAANAHLISAAPSLVEALEETIKFLRVAAEGNDTRADTVKINEVIHSALDKAYGETQ